MRTTLNIDDDVLAQAEKIAAALGAPLDKVVSDTLRAGLSTPVQPIAAKPYRTIPHRMGLRPGYSIDSIQALLDQLDGEDAR